MNRCLRVLPPVLFLLLTAIAPSCRDKVSNCSGSVCRSNVRALHLAVLNYVSDNDWKNPKSIGDLYTGRYVLASTLLCPSSGHSTGSLDDIERWTDYVYVPFSGRLIDMTDEQKQRTPLFIERSPTNHGVSGPTIIYLDGHVWPLPDPCP